MHPALLCTPKHMSTVSSQNSSINAKFKTPQHKNSHEEMNVLHWRQILLHVKVQYMRPYAYTYESPKGSCVDVWLAKEFGP